ncbi:GGDEF domain-containing protein [Velocimicrobium porci]|uniref:GGDEF domain-containing protein n=1 Tax=Velocimicrobium porci TaxID=2606634 RepID=A0A6L5XVR3_9FIRM|nr:GGDEF domain-containing protein [Velocimicrobium porci]MSS62481.1 GGDEF domain-containing protein [Velocimicrobium porci]
MLSLFREDVSELMEAIPFSYDIVSDTLNLFGKSRMCIPLGDKTEHFLENVKNGKLLDEGFQTEILKLCHSICLENSSFESRLQIKNTEERYDYYNIKGKIRKDHQVIHGVLRSLKLEAETVQELEKKAFIDPLTKTYNRNGLEEKLKSEIKFLDKCCKGAMFLIDLDNFKLVNDSMGHLLGDALLIEIAEIIQSVFLENAVISRIGGDEFLVFAYQESDISVYEEKARQLCEKVEEFYNKGDARCPMTLSVGIAIAEENEEFDEIFNHADIALYRVKTSGKNGYFFYETGMKFLPYNCEEGKKREFTENRIGNDGFTYLKLLIDRAIDIANEEESAKQAVERILSLFIETFCVNSAYVYCYNKELAEMGISVYRTKETVLVKMFEPDLEGKSYRKYFNKNGIFYCTNIELLEEKYKEQIKDKNVETMLQVLIQRKGKVIGILGLNYCKAKRLWTQREINAIHTVGKIVSSLMYKLLEMDCR